MKLLGWMHRKFRQNSSEPFKDFTIGHSCNCLSGRSSVDDQQYYPKPSYGPRLSRQPQKERIIRKSFAGLEAATVEEDFEEESSAAMSELFHGFLTIGTLGSDPVIADPATPTFAISAENITEKETEITENDLKLINDELEKVLGAEAKEDGCNISSGRSSHVSTITLSGKQMEETDANGNGAAVCPLQGYLFGSPIELPETTVAKKETRTSLGELFQRSRMVDENSAGKCEREEKRAEKEGEKSSVHLMKKMLKRRILNASSSRNSTAAPSDSVSAEKKLHKVGPPAVDLLGSTRQTILHMFHRKVHPESSTVKKKSSKSHKYETKNNFPNDEGCNNGDQLHPEEDIMIFPQRVISKEGIRCYKSHSYPPQIALSGSDSNGNRECWIKTDAHYLVLEL